MTVSGADHANAASSTRPGPVGEATRCWQAATHGVNEEHGGVSGGREKRMRGDRSVARQVIVYWRKRDCNASQPAWGSILASETGPAASACTESARRGRFANCFTASPSRSRQPFLYYVFLHPKPLLKHVASHAQDQDSQGVQEAFRLTATGKVKCKQTGTRHLNVSLSKSAVATCAAPTRSTRANTPKSPRCSTATVTSLAAESAAGER